MNGTDDWTGPAKATETDDQAKDASTNSYKDDGGKCSVVNGITDALQLGSTPVGTTHEWPDAQSGFAPAKPDAVKSATDYAGTDSGTEDAKGAADPDELKFGGA